ncbi:VolA/Pla-1 family phospholipase [Idiomarina sp.]|uniref:VolA/Pla-1 family phospholipase n=1 Tax=Idiomarina sp. TaxID=1874361 RepID=UPI0025B8A28A|nr:VolA/Pla-1 family phospholipase [Idiomarina sp.]NQZ03659.1 alpha/beta hydrolase [Idiomarina sp.]
MKKLLLPLAIGSALALVGCGSGDSAPVSEQEVSVAATRVAFDPSNSVIPVPSNILLSGTVDGTLNIPVADPSEISNPQVALNGLDGWGTHSTLTFDFSLPVDENGDRVTVTPASLEAQGSIRIFETVQGGSAVSEACAAASPAAACAVVGELEHGTDFTVKAVDNNTVAIVPLRPLKPKTGYIVALTSNIQDSLGRDVKASQTYTLMKRNADENPVSGDASAVSLQRLINSYEGALAQFGVDTESVVYTSNFTTQSVGDVLGVTKQLLAQQIAAQNPPVLVAQDQGISLAQLLQGQGIEDQQTLQIAAAARVFGGQVTLPYYSPLPSQANPQAPINGRWRAACDSPASILGAIEQGVIDPAGAGIPAGAIEDPSLLLPPNACFDFPGVDEERHLTKFNPVPAKQGDVDVPAFVTIPDLAVVNQIRQSRGMETLDGVPAGGWPVVIFQHGITGDKSNAAGIAGSLAAAGFATVAIDHPLHGDRGFDLNNDGTDEINASDNVTAYMNLSNLLAARDNVRQSIADLMGLRVSLNYFQASDGSQINGQKVFFVGHSLGAIAGVGFTGITNTPFAEQSPLSALNGQFAVQATSLAMPGGSVANFLLASPAFEKTIKSQLLYSGSEEFAAAVNAQAEQAGIVPGGEGFDALLIQVYDGFIAQAPEAQLAQINATFEQFAFAAQSVLDSADPVNYASAVVANDSPIHLIEAVGDTVIPNAVEGKPLAGTEPLIRLMGLPSVSATVTSEDGEPVSGAVRFPEADHGSIVSPAASPASTQEMQTQIFSWFGSGMLQLPVTNEEVVQ